MRPGSRRPHRTFPGPCCYPPALAVQPRDRAKGSLHSGQLLRYIRRHADLCHMVIGLSQGEFLGLGKSTPLLPLARIHLRASFQPEEPCRISFLRTAGPGMLCLGAVGYTQDRLSPSAHGCDFTRRTGKACLGLSSARIPCRPRRRTADRPPLMRCGQILLSSRAKVAPAGTMSQPMPPVILWG